MRQLPLRSYHEVSGAIFRTEAGWEVPASYGPLDSEVSAVRSRAGMIDRSDRAKIRVTGEDRVSFLDGLVTADMKTLSPGTSTYALLLNEKSRVLGDLNVLARDDAFVLDIDAAQRDAILAHFEKHLVSDDVAFEDLGPCAHVDVIGPEAEDLVSRVVSADVRGLPPGGFTRFPVDRRTEAVLVRTRAVGEPAFSISSEGSSLADLWDALLRQGVTPIGRDAYDVLRIEAGVPRFGVDMGEDTLALEVAPEGSISFTKGCYLGQEVVARGTYIGEVRRKLMGLRIDGDVPPDRGDKVVRDGRGVGFVTSAAWSPTLRGIVALAILRVDSSSGDAALFVDRAGWDLRARIHTLPFVRRR